MLSERTRLSARPLNRPIEAGSTRDRLNRRLRLDPARRRSLSCSSFGSSRPLLTREPEVRGAERHKAIADVRTGLIATLMALGAAGGLAYTARTYRLGQLAQLTGRFQDASKQMGEEQATVRLAGLHAMAQLADEWTEQRQSCVDVLCAYLRASHEPQRQQEPASVAADHYLSVRRAAVMLIASRLGTERTIDWHGCDFDFTGASMDVGDFSGASFSTGRFSFDQVRFVGRVSFDRRAVRRCRGELSKCELRSRTGDLRRGEPSLQAQSRSTRRLSPAARCGSTARSSRHHALSRSATLGSETGAACASRKPSFEVRTSASRACASSRAGEKSPSRGPLSSAVSPSWGPSSARKVLFDEAVLPQADLSFEEAKLLRGRIDHVRRGGLLGRDLSPRRGRADGWPHGPQRCERDPRRARRRTGPVVMVRGRPRTSTTVRPRDSGASGT